MSAYITVTTITAGSSWEESFESEPYLAPLSDLVMESAWERAFNFLSQKEDVIRQQKDSRVTVTISLYLYSLYTRTRLKKLDTQTRTVELPFGSIAHASLSHSHALNTSRHEYELTIWDNTNDRWVPRPTVIAPDLATAKKLAWECVIEEVESGDYGQDEAGGARVLVCVSLLEGEEVVYEKDHYIDIEPDHDKLIQEAGGDPDCEHEWEESVHSFGGTAFGSIAQCTRCGLIREEYVTGSQFNPGEHDVVRYFMPETEIMEEEENDDDEEEED
jgi:hypothetical protein